ncbi:MAG: chemotaxis protein CheA [Verrucomicrobiota bacterium]|nr:chemotaxis protein CheA [Verrucomicrobiota bacterium]
MDNSNQFSTVFLQEATEQLALIEEIVMEVEGNPTDKDAINRLFRIFHTIKGSGSMFGFDAVAGFTHHVETVLDKVREGELPVTRKLVNLILAAKDQILTMLMGDGDHSLIAKRGTVVAELKAMLACPEQEVPILPPLPLPETNAAIDSYSIHFRPDPGLLARGMDPGSLLNELRALGPSKILALTDSVPPLENLAVDTCHFHWTMNIQTDRGVDAIKDVFIFVEDGSEITIKSSLQKSTLQNNTVSKRDEAIEAHLDTPETLSTEAPGNDPNSSANGSQNAQRKQKAGDGSVRVPSERLDRLVHLVGELVINQSRLAQIANRLDVPDLASQSEDLERLVDELRDNVLGIRMMPIGTTFNRFKRLVRDLSAELGKEIDLVTEGADTELDKTVLDQLGDPLVHLLRNSIDHGIGRPDERLKKGKTARGTIRLTAHHEGANVIITIEDDGRGLDKDAIRTKAIEKNLITADANLSENELYNLILLPGFTTAKTVTNVSGRGVGMDVVKRQIDLLRGTIKISSQPGQGTCITLMLPLTLAIIDGLLVSVQKEQFIIPMAMVMENVELSASLRATGSERNILAVRGELVPYLRLRELFSITGDDVDIERVVIVNHSGKRVGLVVDRILGSHQTVIQSLGKFYKHVEVASGATIMGDGRVVLILDINGLVNHSNQRLSGTSHAEPLLASMV